MAGDINAKHVDWNCRLSTRRGKLLRAYVDENCCLIYGPDSPNTSPYNPLVTSNFLDIAITNILSIPVYLTSCSALSSDNLPVLTDKTFRLSFHDPPERPDCRRTDWPNFQTHL